MGALSTLPRVSCASETSEPSLTRFRLTSSVRSKDDEALRFSEVDEDEVMRDGGGINVLGDNWSWSLFMTRSSTFVVQVQRAQRSQLLIITSATLPFWVDYMLLQIHDGYTLHNKTQTKGSWTDNCAAISKGPGGSTPTRTQAFPTRSRRRSYRRLCSGQGQSAVRLYNAQPMAEQREMKLTSPLAGQGICTHPTRR